MKFDLSGKIALVTGASSGLGDPIRARARGQRRAGGAGIAARRAPQGTAGRDRGRGWRGARGRARRHRLDSIRAAIARAETEAGPIDILVNNSGVSTTQRLVDVTPEDYDFVFDTNTRGSFFVAQEVAKRMIARARGAERLRQARIINIASMAALKVLSQIGIYCMSKAAVVQMTKAMALEWGRYDINVNAICPGYIVTELNEHHWDTEAGRKLVSMLPRKRLGKPEDLDGLILLLSSEHSNFVNGAVIAADDGFGI